MCTCRKLQTLITHEVSLIMHSLWNKHTMKMLWGTCVVHNSWNLKNKCGGHSANFFYIVRLCPGWKTLNLSAWLDFGGMTTFLCDSLCERKSAVWCCVYQTYLGCDLSVLVWAVWMSCVWRCGFWSEWEMLLPGHFVVCVLCATQNKTVYPANDRLPPGQQQYCTSI